ncbi:MAG: YitT family protein [Erysipelotrichaceae bacterium]|nr:YitT family protein [Erysipelotrichaceae bacterium]
MRKIFLDVLCVLIGNTILAFGYAIFAVPANLIVGGATGIGLICERLIGLSHTSVILIFNVLMLIAGFIFLGKAFVAGTVLSTFAFPIFLEVFENLEPLQNITNDILLSTIYAGICIGLGIGIVFRRGYSTGGMDIPPLIINKKTGVSVALLINICDTIILLMQLFFSSFEGILYGLVMVFITNLVLDKVLLVGEKNIQLLVISSKYKEISEIILKEIDRGCTYVEVTTGYLKQPQKAVLSVISSRQYPYVNELILQIDPTAFIISSDIHSVNGRGFTLPNINL